MKRLLILAISILCIGSISFAQTKNPTTATTQTKPAVKKQVAKTQVKQNSTTDKKLSNGATASTTTTTTTSSTTKLKKDGTPDKRFKENKTATVTTTGPKKKDGTPDMRYKANKKKG